MVVFWEFALHNIVSGGYLNEPVWHTSNYVADPGTINPPVMGSKGTWFEGGKYFPLGYPLGRNS